MKFNNFGSECFNTLLPCELKYRRVTRAFPACLKQMSCCGRFHSNILTLPSWAPVMSENMTKTSNRSFIKTYSVCVWNKETLTVLIDGMRRHSLHIIQVPLHDLTQITHTVQHMRDVLSNTYTTLRFLQFLYILQYNLQYSIVWFSERFAWIVHCRCTIKYANYWQYHYHVIPRSSVS